MKFTPDQVNSLPHLSGIYKFYSQNLDLLYVGKAKDLEKRVASYFLDKNPDLKTEKLISLIEKIEFIPVASEFEALLLESKLIKENQPKYNIIWKDDKHYIYVKITTGEFPKILFARKATDNNLYFGPFPSSTVVRQLLSYLRNIFPYCTQKTNVKRACFYTHIGLCNPCPAEVEKTTGEKYALLKKAYRQNINHIKRIFTGKIGSVRKLLSRQMFQEAKRENFEEAAKLRDKIAGLDYLLNQYSPIESYIEDPQFFAKISQKEEKELIVVLKPYFPELTSARHIECYDISNISGKQATGSMVTFKNGQPDKNFYRRFRIKFTHKPNDFAMLKEVMARRLKHQEWKLADIIVIDGGRPQLRALEKVLVDYKIRKPMIGLAKHYEEIVISAGDMFVKLKLAENSPALHLIKRIRDEAHRFAHAYHAHLRLKNLFAQY